MGRRRFSGFRRLLGIGDDAALWKPRSGSAAILTCDWFLEGTHFLRDKHPANAVGWKSLARAVSDVAAMGGFPACFLLSLALPTSLTGRWLDQFLLGLRRAAKSFACPLVGGDTTRKEHVLINITVVGQVPAGKAVLRSGARAGDVLFVSGRLGGAELGLQLIRYSRKQLNPHDPLLRKHLYPQPRLALGHWLADKRLASAMMDISDGLSTDLPRLCFASRLGARIDAQKLPKLQPSDVPTKLGRHGLDPLQLALDGGEDYELLFTVPAKKRHLIPRSHNGAALTLIGEITKKREIVLIEENGHEHPFANRGWDPFQKTS